MRGLARTAGFLLCCAVATGAIAIEPALHVSIVLAGQDGPLEITGMKATGGPGFVSMHIRNVSPKATRDYWVLPLVRSPNGQIFRSVNVHAAITPELGKLAPASEAWDTHTGDVVFAALTISAKELRSTCLRVTPMIMAVEFADGTSWDASPDEMADAMARADRLAQAPACKNSAEASASLIQIDAYGVPKIGGIGRKARESDPHEPEESNGSQAFTFACPLIRVSDSSVHAMCGIATDLPLQGSESPATDGPAK